MYTAPKIALNSSKSHCLSEKVGHPDHDLNSQKSLFMRLLRVFFLSGTQKCVIDVLCCYEADFSILSLSKLEMVSQPRAVASFISCV